LEPTKTEPLDARGKYLLLRGFLPNEESFACIRPNAGYEEFVDFDFDVGRRGSGQLKRMFLYRQIQQSLLAFCGSSFSLIEPAWKRA